MASIETNTQISLLKSSRSMFLSGSNLHLSGIYKQISPHSCVVPIISPGYGVPYSHVYHWKSHSHVLTWILRFLISEGERCNIRRPFSFHHVFWLRKRR